MLDARRELEKTAKHDADAIMRCISPQPAARRQSPSLICSSLASSAHRVSVCDLNLLSHVRFHLWRLVMVHHVRLAGKIALMRIVRWFFGLLLLAALAFGAAYYFAGTLDGPAITINQPSVIGQGGTLDVSVDAPGGELTALDIQLEQKGTHLSCARPRVGSSGRSRQGRRSRPRDAGRSARRRCRSSRAAPRR